MPTVAIGFNLFKQISKQDAVSNVSLNIVSCDLDDILFISWSSVVHRNDNLLECAGFLKKKFELPCVPESASLRNKLLCFVINSTLNIIDTSLNKPSLKWEALEYKGIKSVQSNETVIYCVIENGSLVQLSDRIFHNVPLPDAIVVKAIDCGIDHTVGLTEYGQVLSWGIGSRGQLGHGNLSDTDYPMIVDAILGVRIKKAKAGGWHTVLLAESGDLYVFGWNNVGQLGFKITDKNKQNNSENFNTNDNEPSIGMANVPMLLELESYLNASDFATIVDIDCGTFHSAAVTKCGIALTWGQGKYGQLGQKCCTNIKFKDQPDLCVDNSTCKDKAHLPQQIDILKDFTSMNVKCGPWNTFIKYKTTVPNG